MDTYSIVFLALAVFFILVRSVLRLRTGSERPVTDTFFYRLAMIAAVLGAVLYVASKTQWYSVLQAALTPVATPIVAAPTVAAPTVAAPAAAWAPEADSVPIYPTNNDTSAMIDVVFGGQPLRMLFDTGATTCLISEAIAARIVRDGYGVRQGAGRFKMADGTIRTLPILLIREIQIGRHTIRSVPAGVSSAGAMLLAFPVVNAIAPFTIDTRARVLIFQLPPT